MNTWKVTGVELKAQITKLEGQIQCHILDLTQSKELLQQEKGGSADINYSYYSMAKLINTNPDMQKIQ